jgi:hypothetical protein
MLPKKSLNTDIYAGMKPLHFAAQLVGLAPYAYVRREQTGEETLDISRRCNVKKIIWGLLLLGVQFIGILCKLAQSITSPPATLMDFVSDLIQIPFFSATSIGALIFALTVNRKKMLEFINTLSVVDRCLLHENNIYKRQNIALLIAVTCITMTSIIIFYFDVYYYTTYNMLYVITIYLPDYIWSINELQFMNIVETLRVRLATLNGHVPLLFVQETHTEIVPSNFRKHSGRYIRTSQSCIRTELLRNYVRDELKVGPAQTCSHKSEVTNDMLKLSEVYNKLYEMCRLINSMYGYMLLQESASYTVCITADGYNLLSFLIALYKAEDPLIPPGGCPALILWNISNLIRLFAICLACQRVINEVSRTVNRIETLKLQSDLSADVSNQLRILSKQIEQSKIEFSACGFIDINLSHFCAVVLTTTTYITMLVFLER